DGAPRAHRILADDARLTRLAQRGLHALEWLRELSANVDVARLRADRVAADRTSFDERMRRPAHELSILERAGLGLVGVADEIVRFAVAGLHERPLHASGIPRPRDRAVRNPSRRSRRLRAPWRAPARVPCSLRAS